MKRQFTQPFREIFELLESERATLAGLLIESLEPPPAPDVQEAWAHEAEQARKLGIFPETLVNLWLAERLEMSKSGN